MTKKEYHSNQTENDIPKNEDVPVESVDADDHVIDNQDIDEQELELEEITEEDSAELISEVEKLQNEVAENKDKYLRLAAEFDNYRKRTIREKTELIQTAGDSLLKDILPIMDDFERGLEVVNQAEDVEAVKTGMELIYQKLKDFIESKGVKEIKAMNEPFDADWHEAVTNIPAPSEDMKGKIVDVIQKGYVLHDKIIRYPKVVVGE